MPVTNDSCTDARNVAGSARPFATEEAAPTVSRASADCSSLSRGDVEAAPEHAHHDAAEHRDTHRGAEFVGGLGDRRRRTGTRGRDRADHQVGGRGEGDADARADHEEADDEHGRRTRRRGREQHRRTHGRRRDRSGEHVTRPPAPQQPRRGKRTDHAHRGAGQHQQTGLERRHPEHDLQVLRAEEQHAGEREDRQEVGHDRGARTSAARTGPGRSSGRRDVAGVERTPSRRAGRASAHEQVLDREPVRSGLLHRVDDRDHGQDRQQGSTARRTGPGSGHATRG